MAETFRFVTEGMDPRGAQVLEVGCGDGALAAALMRAGHRVTAIDSSPERVREARVRGVPATVAVWPDFGGCCFDHVLFTRSLHHVDDLESAVDRARRVLESGGSILVEDFAFHDASESTVRWFAELVRETMGRTGSPPAPGSFVEAVAGADDALAAWSVHRQHIHPFATVRTALGRGGSLLSEARAPYLYRYLAALPGTDLAAVFEAEVAAAAAGRIELIGRRLVAF